MGQQKNDSIRILRVRKGDDVKTLYAKARRAFTAADLQKYADHDEMLPAEQLVADLEAIHREEKRKRRRKKA
jgi:hypothetical protein